MTKNLKKKTRIVVHTILHPVAVIKKLIQKMNNIILIKKYYENFGNVMYKSGYLTTISVKKKLSYFECVKIYMV